jgi:hypothetical protein
MKKKKLTPINSAELLYKTLIGFVGLNLKYDDAMGEPNKEVLKARAANYGLIREAIISADFINLKGLEKEYRDYMAAVDLKVLKIRDRSEKGGKE